MEHDATQSILQCVRDSHLIQFVSQSAMVRGTRPGGVLLLQHPALLSQIREQKTDGVELKFEMILVDSNGEGMTWDGRERYAGEIVDGDIARLQSCT